jgi:hypothetical protein
MKSMGYEILGGNPGKPGGDSGKKKKADRIFSDPPEPD